jgi:TRAP-type C4-dicarboxylate transport system permease small subunit
VRLRQLGRSIEQGIHTVSRMLSYTSVFVLFTMMLLITGDVLGRFVANSPVRGSTDFVELMMITLVFFPLAECAAQDGHIRVDVVFSHLPKYIQAKLDSVTFFASASIAAIIAWRLGNQVYKYIVAKMPMLTPIWEFSYLPFICLAAVGSLFLSLELLISFFHSLNRER